ncbi:MULTISPECIES: adenylyltransferase/cytidyltransferase family protein [Nitrosarchaeum]|uniref:Cytidyltransferase-related domain-containing protein n=1 Tax=Nitrosarchaeum koreense MY1 TaxID=1001994 RepID=F9CZ50_9ARCH|nr:MULTISPECIES: adenylyltransferase/cytidyltransferase family protein [Nitrosarchaeum]EGP94208.1 Cytidyltransferase-related domain-containing protein [Nitrosarchaeum koreense MY1]QLH11395.1 cytidyltransferase [Nitrosarchaeum sp. AC2]
MELIEKIILTQIYLSGITGKSYKDNLKTKKGFTENIINSKIDELVKNKLITEDKSALTELGRSSLRVVLAGGVFDIIHPGHIHTLNAAKILGDVLVVVVATDNTAIKMKKRQPLHSKEQRQELVNSLSMVDLCLIGQEDDIFKTVNLVKPQIIALGYDQVHQEKFIIEGCKKINLDAKVARLQSPIPESSSSKIQKEYGESIHGI